MPGWTCLSEDTRLPVWGPAARKRAHVVRGQAAIAAA